jgi:uncharacterized repeat protein (TIGR01451 family)
MNLALFALTLPMTMALPPEGPKIPAPLLYVKVTGPEGLQTTWITGEPEGTQFDRPATVGIRPGYHYRFALSNIPGNRAARLFPSLEVHGSLQVPRHLDPVKHPVPLVFTEDDLNRALEGKFICKAICLEDPDKADPLATKPLQLLESAVGSEKEAIEAARGKGRLLVILRFGEREYTTQELLRENLPNTILLPGQASIGMPPLPPPLTWGCIPLYDPILGKIVSKEECLFDGGDTKIPLGINLENKLYGLDASDTAVEFNLTNKGRRVVPSNRVPICVPRYVAFRCEAVPTGHQLVAGPMGASKVDPAIFLAAKTPPLMVKGPQAPQGMQNKQRAQGTNGSFNVAVLELFTGRPMAVAQLNKLQVIAEVREPEDITAFPKYQPMVLHKWITPKHPQEIGEIITVHLRFQNTSSSPMTEVVVSDSLTARLEYIEGSAKTDRPATLTVKPNEAGSVVLRWAIDGKVLAGESGLITFQAKIR